MKKITLLITAICLVCTLYGHDRERNTSTNPARSEVLLSGGHEHSIFIQDGEVLCVGNNNRGQLGNGVLGGMTFTPAKVGGLTDVIAVSAGNFHSLVLRADGTVWAWGDNSTGQLGVSPGTMARSLVPFQVPGVSDIIGIAAGGNHNLALKSDGTVISWGGNISGQCGQGTGSTPFELPAAVVNSGGISPLEGVTLVTAGAEHSLAILDGKVNAWGDNTGSQIGLPTSTTFSDIPVVIQDFAGADLEKIISISAGNVHSVALDVNGNLWTWGNGFNGQLGIGPISKSVPSTFIIPQAQMVTNRVRTITAGSRHTLYVDAAGDLWGFGANDRGQLSSSAPEEFSPVLLGINMAVGLAAGNNFSLMLESDGDLTGSGAGTKGQIGLAFADRILFNKFDVISGKIAVLATHSNSYMLKADGTLWVTGEHTGLGTGSTSDITTEIQNTLLTDIIAIAGTDEAAFALDVFGSVFAWGDNSFGECGVGTMGSVSVHLTPVKLSLFDIVHIEGAVQGGFSGSGDHVNAIDVNGNLFAWGANDQFKLGDGTTTTRDLPVGIATVGDVFTTALHAYNTFVLFADNTVEVWGKKSTSGSTSGSYPVVSPFPIDGSGTDRYKEISASRRVGMGLKTDGTIKMWGGKVNNAPNLFSTTASTSADYSGSPVIVFESPSSTVPLGSIKAIDLGDEFVSVVKADGMCWLWGRNSFGSLGRRTFTSEETTPAIDSLQIVNPNILFKSVNSEHQVLANQSNEFIYTWGRGGFLGDGSTSSNAEATSNMRPDMSEEDVHENADSFSVYPNPFSDIVYIKLQEQTGNEPIMIELYGTNGAIVFTESIMPQASVVKLDLSQLDQGLYLYRIKGMRRSGRLLKR